MPSYKILPETTSFGWHQNDMIGYLPKDTTLTVQRRRTLRGGQAGRDEDPEDEDQTLTPAMRRYQKAQADLQHCIDTGKCSLFLQRAHCRKGYKFPSKNKTARRIREFKAVRRAHIELNLPSPIPEYFSCPAGDTHTLKIQRRSIRYLPRLHTSRIARFLL